MKKIIIVSGDPNSINSEIIFKSWKKISQNIQKKIFVVGSYNLLHRQFKKMNYPIRLKNVKNLNEVSKKKELKIIDVNLNFDDPFNVKQKTVSTYIKKCLNLAHRLSVSKKTAGLINCAINKKLLPKKNIGVTELLADKCKIKKDTEVMMIKSKNLSVCPITTHLNLKDVSKNISSNKIIAKVHTIQNCYKRFYKKKPKIGIMGLNPHNAELRDKSEEVNQIIPAIKKLKKLGFNVNGPLVADTLFVKDYKNFNVIVGMYHDQILTPFKSIYKFNAINVTLGLKYLRVSPDHGVGKDIIKKNVADYSSLLDCIKFINKFG